MYDQRSIRRYQETDINSMGKEKMIALLYEKMVSCYQRAEEALVVGDRVTMTDRVNLAQQIVIELRNALDHDIGGDISRNLEALYDFVFQENLKCLVDCDPQHLRNAVRVLMPLLEAWRQIEPGTAERATRQRENDGDGPNPAKPEQSTRENGRADADGVGITIPESEPNTSQSEDARRLHPQLCVSA